MKKILVTGGLGFIGSNLIELLVKKNFYVINIDKISYSSNFYNTKEYIGSKNYKFIKCDINDKKFKNILFKYKPECIFNLAADSHVDRSIDNPENFIQNNIVGVYNLLESFRKFINKYRSKLIHVSTDEVYGDIKIGRASEEFSYNPSSPYAASKASSDHLVRSYVKTYNIPAIVTNCSNNYGPRQHPEKLIPKLIYNIFNNKDFPIYGNGKNSREWIYVKDHCDALFKIYQKGKIGNFYNIGSNENLTNLQVCRKLIGSYTKLFKKKVKSKIIFVKDRPGHDFRYAIDCKKINQNLNWYAKTNFEKGILFTLQWYYKNNNYFNYLNKNDILNRFGK